ncbi:cholesterol 24-hydroxylase-like isoform X2 [Amphiura filiformis]|uniref:cholesterol 24-hydroxylase-like isoform X2 n=1 Tax=Amphiura filiformis TaxID=82378 RepID=UPI003B21A89A
MASFIVTIILGVLLIALAIVFAIFCFITVYIYYVHRKYSHIPQLPMPSFYLGHKKYLDESYDENSDRSSDMVLYDMHKELGSPPVFLLHALHITLILVMEPNAVKVVVFDKRHPKPMAFYKTFCYMYGQRFTGRGLLTEMDYEQWHKRRVILNTAFHRKFLKDLMDPFNNSTTLFMKKLLEKADGKTEISMSEHFNRCTLDVISKVAFGMDLDIIENEDSSFNKQVLVALRGMIVSGDPTRLFDFSSKARKEKEDVLKAVRSLREIGRQCINKRIDEMNSGEEVPEDVLTYIIKAGQEVNGDDKEKMEVMIDEFTLFFFAGMETTANTLSFAVIALGRHPEVLHRLQIEIDAVIGDKTYISYEDINKLEYTMQVLKETLRLWSPVTGMTRQLFCDIDVDGYKIPAGSNVVFQSFLMARMEKYYHNAHDFDPDRFKSDEDTMQYTYFPFALGPRSCIGQQFALIEARVILARFVSTFEFVLVPGQKFTFINEGTMKPKEGCKVYLTAKI